MFNPRSVSGVCGVQLLTNPESVSLEIGCGGDSRSSISTLSVTCSYRSVIETVTINSINRNVQATKSACRNRMKMGVRGACAILGGKSSMHAPAINRGNMIKRKLRSFEIDSEAWAVHQLYHSQAT